MGTFYLALCSATLNAFLPSCEQTFFSGARTAKTMAEPAPVPPKQRKRKWKSMFDSLAVITS